MLKAGGFYAISIGIMDSLHEACTSAKKGVVADFVPGAQSEGAFANIMMQVTLFFVVFFFSLLLCLLLLEGNS